VIVRDMWLTGFDAPCLHTMYADKPMRGHGLMQTIARVNRVFGDKPGGLVVDYLGLADQLRRALADYTESHGKGRPTIDQNEAVALVLEKYEVVAALCHGFDWSKWTTGTPGERLSLLPAAQEHILGQQDGKTRLLREVTALSQGHGLFGMFLLQTLAALRCRLDHRHGGTAEPLRAIACRRLAALKLLLHRCAVAGASGQAFSVGSVWDRKQ
jgi:type I site-specific restriction-modification system R (restriction) subunit